MHRRASDKAGAFALLGVGIVIAALEMWRVFTSLLEPSPEVFGNCPQAGPSRQGCIRNGAIREILSEDWFLIALLGGCLLGGTFLLLRRSRHGDEVCPRPRRL
jgi:hypothetical protein